MKRTLAHWALRGAVLCLAGLALAPAVASAQAILHTTRVDDMIQVDVSVFWHDMPAQWVAVVVQRWTVGLCDDETIVTPAPWPREVPAPSDPSNEYSLLTPVPGENRCYGYVVKALDADGNLSAVCDAGEMPYDFVSCGLAIVARGYLLVYPWDPDSPPRLEACAEDCWGTAGFIDFSAVDPATYTPYITFQPGVPVDIFGWIEVTDLITNAPVKATLVAPTPSGLCGPLPVESSSWGRVKTGYR